MLKIDELCYNVNKNLFKDLANNHKQMLNDEKKLFNKLGEIKDNVTNLVTPKKKLFALFNTYNNRNIITVGYHVNSLFNDLVTYNINPLSQAKMLKETMKTNKYLADTVFPLDYIYIKSIDLPEYNYFKQYIEKNLTLKDWMNNIDYYFERYRETYIQKDDYQAYEIIDFYFKYRKDVKEYSNKFKKNIEEITKYIKNNEDIDEETVHRKIIVSNIVRDYSKNQMNLYLDSFKKFYKIIDDIYKFALSNNNIDMKLPR